MSQYKCKKQTESVQAMASMKACKDMQTAFIT